MTENIGFQITDGGTIANVEQLLVELGLTGSAALKRIQDGYTNLEVGAQEAANSQKIYAAAVSAGLTSTVQLYQALDKLTNSEINAAASANNLSRLQTGIATGFSQTRSAAQDVSAALNAAASGQQKLADSTGGFTSRANAATAALTSTTGAATNATSAFTSLGGSAGSAGDGLARVSTASKLASSGVANLSAGFQKATSAVSGLVASLAAYVGVKGIEEAADEYTGLHNKLSLVISDTGQLATEQAKLGQIANASQTDIGAVVNTFVRFRSVTDQSTTSIKQINDAVQGLSIGLVVTGTHTGETARVMKDFTEALAQGELQGRQLNSVLSQSPAFAKLLADALGLTVAQLKEASPSADDLIRALGKIGQTYTTISASQTTFSGALTVLHNNFVLLFQDGTNVSASLAIAKEGIVLLANNIDKLVPLMEALAGAFIGLKLANFIQECAQAAYGIGLMIIGVVQLTAAFLVSPIGVFTLAVVLLTSAMIAVARACGLALPSFKDLYQEALSLLPTAKSLGINMDGVGQSANGAVPKIQANTAALNANANAAEHAAAAQNAYHLNAQGGSGYVNPNGDQGTSGGSITNRGSVFGGAGYTNLGGGTSVSNDSFGGTNAGNLGGGGFSTSGVLDSNYSGDYANRDGGVYRIPGGSGVDSVPLNLRVSPGEVVHVMTPMQAMGRGFRDGGAVTTGLGVSLGTNTSITAANQNVTGFAAPVAVALADTSTAVSTNTASTDANTAAVVASTTVAQSAISQLQPQLASGSVTDASTSTAGTSSSTSTVGSSGSFAQGIDFSGNSNPFLSQAATGSSVKHAGTASKGGAVVNGVLVPNGYYVKNADGTTTYQPTVNRDGGDMYVSGGGGVDSHRVQMAVSPGESIHVRTPMQRREASQQGTGGNVIQNIVVHAANVREFGNSQGQVVAHAARAAQVARRKVRG